MRQAILFSICFAALSAVALSQGQQKAPATAAPKPAAAPAAKPAAAPAAKPAAAPAVKPAAPAAAAAPSKPDPAAEEAQKALKELNQIKAERKKAEDFVHEWFRRWSALDGKDETINALMELYNPDAVLEMGPNDRQLGGAVTYEGDKLIRRMAQDFSKTWSTIAYRPAMRTIDEKTAELIQVSQAPWGATQIGVEFTGGQANTDTKKRYMLRGAAFFELENGKLSYMRIYIPKDEMLEITGPTSVGM